MNITRRATRTHQILIGITCGALLSVAFGTGCGDSGSTGGTGGSAPGTGGGGGAVHECDLPSDCPDPGTECVVRLCLNNTCGTLAAPYGTPTIDQSDGDCQLSVCDGNGGTTSIDDDADVLDDAKQCTVDICKGGTLEHNPAIPGTPCNEGGGTRCDSAGACVECNSDAECVAGAVCDAGKCVSASCIDGVKNGTESDVDCGGASCAGCDLTKACTSNTDCASGLCAGGECAATTPIISAISANGHDRFFNLVLDAQGNIFTVGVSAPGTDAATDFSSIVAKFTPQGVLDTTFGTGGVFTKNLAVGTSGELARAIGLQSTGKIVVAATVEHVGATDARDRDVAVMRLNTDGTLDTTFGTNGVAILDLSPGQLVGSSYLADSVWHLVVQQDDKIVLSGGQVRPGGTDTDFAMVRLLANGAVDGSFGTSGKVLVDINNANASPRGLTLLPDGSLIGSGYYTVMPGVIAPVVYKVTSAGVLDTTFATGGVFSTPVLAAQTEAYSVALQGNKLVTTGYGYASSTTESLDWTSLRFLPNGNLDPTYGTNGLARVDITGFADQSRAVLVLPDNRVMLIGGGRPTSSNVDGAVGVLTPNGQLDGTFSPTGVKLFDLGGANDFLWAGALAPSGKYVVFAGVKGIASGGTGHDDAALLLLPVE